MFRYFVSQSIFCATSNSRYLLSIVALYLAREFKIHCEVKSLNSSRSRVKGRRDLISTIANRLLISELFRTSRYYPEFYFDPLRSLPRENVAYFKTISRRINKYHNSISATEGGCNRVSAKRLHLHISAV